MLSRSLRVFRNCSKEVCEKEIERTKQMFIMDYAGDLASCGTNAELRLHPPANIAGMISQYEVAPAFLGSAFDDPEELFLALRNANNSFFQPFRLNVEESELLERPVTFCYLQRKH